MIKRKCTFRFLYVAPSRDRYVVTQDMRRRRNVVTGNIHISCRFALLTDQSVAELLGCQMIVRAKA